MNADLRLLRNPKEINTVHLCSIQIRFGIVISRQEEKMFIIKNGRDEYTERNALWNERWSSKVWKQIFFIPHPTWIDINTLILSKTLAMLKVNIFTIASVQVKEPSIHIFFIEAFHIKMSHYTCMSSWIVCFERHSPMTGDPGLATTRRLPSQRTFLHFQYHFCFFFQYKYTKFEMPSTVLRSNKKTT